MRTIMLGAKGLEVVAWQKAIGVAADGDFGLTTRVATMRWQEAKGLVPDGIVGPKSWAAAGFKDTQDQRAPACVAALRDANARWPRRSRVSDGVMGDASHAARASDHNSGNAVDITHDPAGPTGDEIAAAAIRDPRVTYVIWHGRIYNRARSAEGWREYKGSNAHNHHVHISIAVDMRNDDGPWLWAP